MTEQLIKTGIYKHYKKGDLYFVEKTFTFKQSGKEDVPSVYYYPLYEVSNGDGRSISEFTEMVHITVAKEASPSEDELPGIEIEGKDVKRFELVKELDPKYCKMLLPGSKVVPSNCLFPATEIVLSSYLDSNNKIITNLKTFESNELSTFSSCSLEYYIENFKNSNSF